MAVNLVMTNQSRIWRFFSASGNKPKLAGRLVPALAAWYAARIDLGARH